MLLSTRVTMTLSLFARILILLPAADVRFKVGSGFGYSSAQAAHNNAENSAFSWILWKRKPSKEVS